MRKFLGTVVLAVIVLAVVGGARDWFSIQQRSDGDSTAVHLLIHREKIRTDTQNAREVARELGENLGNRIERRLGRAPAVGASRRPTSRY